MNVQFIKPLMTAFLITLPGVLFAENNDVDVAKAIRAQNDLYEKYYATDNASALTQLHTKDATVIAPNYGPANGHEEIQAGLEEELALGEGNLKLTILETVRLSEDTAYEISRYTLRIDLAEGDPIVDEGNTVVIWRLGDDGVWRIHVDTWNTSLPLE